MINGKGALRKDIETKRDFPETLKESKELGEGIKCWIMVMALALRKDIERKRFPRNVERVYRVR